MRIRTGCAGQSMVEYIVIFTAIVAVLVIAAAGPLRGAIQSMFDSSSGAISDAAGRIGQ